MTFGHVLREQRGATMVFGIFFAVFLIACVYRLHALGEVLLFRQAQQDAADSAAFASAVVNARGMNLMALINMTMAVVLSVLVGLRLAQTLCALGIVICIGLYYPTVGQSLSYVPLFAKATAKVSKWANKVEDLMPEVLGALHMAGKAISIVVPVGSNARVIELVATQYGRVGVAIPGRLTLPVEDGEFMDLCRHAGELAGQIAMLPLSPFMPDFVSDGLSQATSTLATTAPDWFCGDGEAQPPDLNGEQREHDPQELPIMPKQQRCMVEVDAFTAALDELEDGEAVRREAEVDAVCRAAAAERLAAQPSTTGKAREGEPLCPSDCGTKPRESCPAGNVDCDPVVVRDLEVFLLESGEPNLVSAGPGSPYATRTALAREQCNPSAQHAYPLGGVWWIRQTVDYEYQWVGDPKTGKGSYRRVGEPSEGEETLVQNRDEDRSVPCGRGGTLSDEYSVEAGRVCQGAPRCLTDSAAPFGTSGPCLRRPPPMGPSSFREQEVRAMEILRCVELKPHQPVEVEDMNLEQDLQEGNTGDLDTSPFQLEKGVWLGGNDFQLRSLVVQLEDSEPRGVAAVRLATWGKADGRGAFSTLARSAGRLGLAQAEYYFDVGTFKDEANQNDPKDVVEWLWEQGWVARLRPFRLNQSRADGPRNRQVGFDQVQLGFAPEASSLPTTFSAACTQPGCGDVGGLLNGLGVGEVGAQ